jgi:hypothetical protein
MPPLLLAAIVLGVGFLLYERFFVKPGSASPATPQLPPVRRPGACSLAQSVSPGRQYLFAVVPAAAGVLATTPAQIASTLSAGGVWQGVQAWDSRDPSVPAYSWPPSAQPGPGVFLARGTYAGPPSPVPPPGLVQGVLDCGNSSGVLPGSGEGATIVPGSSYTRPAGPRTVALHGNLGLAAEAITISNAAQALLAGLGPEPPPAAGFTAQLQWQIPQAALQQLLASPTMANLRAASQNLANPSQGPLANSVAASLHQTLIDLGG